MLLRLFFTFPRWIFFFLVVLCRIPWIFLICKILPILSSDVGFCPFCLSFSKTLSIFDLLIQPCRSLRICFFPDFLFLCSPHCIISTGLSSSHCLFNLLLSSSSEFFVLDIVVFCLFLEFLFGSFFIKKKISVRLSVYPFITNIFSFVSSLVIVNIKILVNWFIWVIWGLMPLIVFLLDLCI